jgi:hypothetical protein
MYMWVYIVYIHVIKKQMEKKNKHNDPDQIYHFI